MTDFVGVTGWVCKSNFFGLAWPIYDPDKAQIDTAEYAMTMWSWVWTFVVCETEPPHIKGLKHVFAIKPKVVFNLVVNLCMSEVVQALFDSNSLSHSSADSLAVAKSSCDRERLNLLRMRLLLSILCRQAASEHIVGRSCSNLHASNKTP